MGVSSPGWSTAASQTAQDFAAVTSVKVAFLNFSRPPPATWLLLALLHLASEVPREYVSRAELLNGV